MGVMGGTWFTREAAEGLIMLFEYLSTEYYILTGCHNTLEPWRRAPRKWRENEEIKRKWRENEEMERKWRDNETMKMKWRENEEMERD